MYGNRECAGLAASGLAAHVPLLQRIDGEQKTGAALVAGILLTVAQQRAPTDGAAGSGQPAAAAAAAAAPERCCAVCGTARGELHPGPEAAHGKLQLCSVCYLGVRYCSTQCQLADWPFHSIKCKSPEEAAASS